MATMRTRLMKSLALGAVAWALVAGPAGASVREFNEAMANQDYVAANAAAAEVWSDFDRSAPETATIAREFGFTAYLAGDYEAAKRYAEFLDREGAGLATPDDQPLTSQVLLALAEYKLNPDNRRRRRALIDALEERIDGPAGADGISLVAAEDLQHTDWESGSWDEAVESASLAAAMAGKGGDAYLVRRRNAEISAEVARFQGSYDPVSFVGFADTHDAIARDIDRIDDESLRDQLWPLLFGAEAWAETVRAHTVAYPPRASASSTGTRMNGIRSAHSGSTAETRNDLLGHEARLSAPALHFGGRMIPSTKVAIRERTLIEPATPAPGAAAEAAASVPRCAGEWRGETRGSAGTWGSVGRFGTGAVVLRYEVTEDGRVHAPEPIAAAPFADYAEEALEMMESWRFEPARGADTSSCRIASDYEKSVIVFSPGAER